MGEAGVLDHVKRMSFQVLVIFVSCVSVFWGGCSRDEGDVAVMPLKVCLISFFEECPAEVLLRLAGPKDGCSDIPMANVSVERVENQIFLEATAPAELFGPVDGVICDAIVRVHGSVTVKGLAVGEYEIVFRTRPNLYNKVHRFPGFFLRIEEGTAYLFTATDNKRHVCFGEW